MLRKVPNEASANELVPPCTINTSKCALPLRGCHSCVLVFLSKFTAVTYLRRSTSRKNEFIKLVCDGMGPHPYLLSLRPFLNTECLSLIAAVSFWGQTNRIPSTVSPKRDCSPNWVSVFPAGFLLSSSYLNCQLWVRRQMVRENAVYERVSHANNG